MINAFSVDLEEWFCPSYLENSYPVSRWDDLESRIVPNTLKLLKLLKSFEVRATFFIMGWVAKKFPFLIEKIAEEGHETGVHGFYHRHLGSMSPGDFRADLEKALYWVKEANSEIVITGFRAPMFSISEKTIWATDILREFGFSYDSSVYPFGLHPNYGVKDAPLTPFYFGNGLLEVPLSCTEKGKFRIPCSGGGYFRLYPYYIFKKMVFNINKAGRFLVFYIHPWEIDNQLPDKTMNLKYRFRLRHNQAATMKKLEKLLEDFKFLPVSELIAGYKENVVTSF